ncbi:MAG TPA: peptidylprolyl isomerase, partial [Flavisolibacter sp.]|nr:peptidylprolyl isomerase [Flavisolibacter sp.]
TADSLYNRLQAGDDFGKLATAFSNDVISAANEGQMSEFGVGDYDAAFETAVLALAKDGDISKPFLTTHGYHIVKRIKLSPVSTKFDEETREALRRRVEQSDRVQFSKKALAQKIIKQVGYKKQPFAEPELWAYTDSVLTYQVPRIKVTLKPTSTLLKMGDHSASVSDWVAFAQGHRYRPDGSGARPYALVWDDFIEATALDYYQDHLEKFNDEFRQQMTEFAEGNLFFEIMQRQVWTPAQTDSVGLEAYYKAHKASYNWKESADAVLFYAVNEDAAKTFYAVVSKKPAEWKTALTNYAEQITADSNRFELAQIPKAETEVITAGTVTTPVVNKADNTASFAYVLRLHNKPEPRSFAEAKGLVMNDYQNELEKQWLQKLKKKYPVSVNQKVWSEVVRKAGSKQQVVSR